MIQSTDDLSIASPTCIQTTTPPLNVVIFKILYCVVPCTPWRSLLVSRLSLQEGFAMPDEDGEVAENDEEY